MHEPWHPVTFAFGEQLRFGEAQRGSIRARGDRSPRLGAQAAAALRAVGDRGRAPERAWPPSRRERHGKRRGPARAQIRSDGEAEGRPRTLIGTIAVVGFPNVGKSTLVNRLTATRETVVHEQPGVTRDRKELVVEWGGAPFAILDTGGVDAGDAGAMQGQIAEQARAAVAEADLVLFLVDATTSPGPTRSSPTCCAARASR